MASATTDYPLVLFPLKLETRFISDQLWIRVFPDIPFLQSHDPKLTREEIEDAQVFKQKVSEEKLETWEILVAKYGVYRASYLVQISEEDLNAQVANEANDKEQAPDFYFKWLPDNLLFYLYKEGDTNPSYTEVGQQIKSEGLLILEGENDWLQNFEVAEKAGMAVKVSLLNDDDHFEKVIVSGFRNATDKLDSASGLANIFHNHQYTEGFSFLEYGTATNNTETTQSGYSAKDEFDAANSFEYAAQGLKLNATSLVNTGIKLEKAGSQLSKALGFDTNHLQHVQNADITRPALNELYQKASWFALGAQNLFMLFGEQIGIETHEKIWDHYSKYVKARGNYPAVKIGNQPYGILPVMNISSALENEEQHNEDSFFDKMLHVLAHLKQQWLKMANTPFNIPKVGDNETDNYLEILKILSLQEASSSYQIRAMEYHDFQRKHDEWLKRTTNIPIDDPSYQITPQGTLKKDYINAVSRVNTIRKLFSNSLSAETDELQKDFIASLDQLIKAPLMSLKYGKDNLIKFENNQSKTINSDGIIIQEYSTNEETKPSSLDNFTLTETDLSQFENFLNQLSKSDGLGLNLYQKDLNIFIDLFLRSYINASQLYHRVISFEPGSAAIKSYNFFNVSELLISEGTTVTKGQTILIIQKKKVENSNNLIAIEIKAPFDGLIKKYHVQQNDSLQTGSSLFTLVNETKHQKIKKTFIALGLQIVKASNADTDESTRQKAQEKAFGEAIDLNSYRLDAWITSLAARKIDELRNSKDHKKGIYFGAYGWIENLRKDENEVDENTMLDTYFDEGGGIIHAPNSAQAVALSVFKNSFLAHKNEDPSNPFTLNLSSDRLQKSQVLLEGIRQGQQLEALLGYQLERHLHEAPIEMHKVIYQLRAAYPLYENSNSTNGLTNGFVNLSVVDGLKVIDNKDKLNLDLGQKKNKLLQSYIAKLEDTLDASLDSLFYEAGYQVTQGNLSQAAAALDATKGEIEPPITEALKTRIPGTGITHKLVMLFPKDTPVYDPIQNSRAAIEPVLENWLANQIGPLTKIGCKVELRELATNVLISTTDVRLSDLKIGHLDFLYLSNDELSDSASELEMRIWQFVKTQTGIIDNNTKYIITDASPQNCQSLAKALEVIRYAYTLLSKCHYLKSEELTTEGETIEYDWRALNDLKTDFLSPLISHLASFVESASSFSKSQLAESISFLSKFDFENAKIALFSESPINLDELKNEINNKLKQVNNLLGEYNEDLPFYAAFELLEQAIKILFGKNFIVLPPAVLSPNFKKVLKNKKQERLVGQAVDSDSNQVWGQERIQNWLQGIAQVKENTACLEDWQMVNQVWNNKLNLSNPYEYHIVQAPTLEQYPWSALSKKEIGLLVKKHYTIKTIYKDPKSGKAYPIVDSDDYYPDDCDSTVIYASSGLKLVEQNGLSTCYGLVIEEFTEHIPNKKINTGLSFQYNAPNSEAPQAILLAVHSKSNFSWREEDLRDIIKDTMDLYKIRMVDLEAMKEYDYMLPMTYWFNIPKLK